jgi:hypothetical protein
MPNRVLKESIRESESIDELSHAAECTFYRLLTFVDDFGLFKANARIVNRGLFPLRDYADDDVAEWLNEISQVGMLAFYIGEDGKPYGCFTNWERYNKPRNTKPKYPQPTEATEVYNDYHTFASVCMQLKSNADNRLHLPVTENISEHNQAKEDNSPRSSIRSSNRSRDRNKNLSSDVPPDAPDKNPKPFDSQSSEIKASQLLFSLISKRDSKIRSPDFQKWAIHVDRLIRIDGREPEEIETVIRWCQNDSFWRNNILSTEKLRKQFPQLVLKMKENGNGHGYGDRIQQQNVKAAKAFLEGTV